MKKHSEVGADIIKVMKFLARERGWAITGDGWDRLS